MAIDASASSKDKERAKLLEREIKSRLDYGVDRIESFGFATSSEIVNYPTTDTTESARFDYPGIGRREELLSTRFDYLFQRVAQEISRGRRNNNHNGKALIIISDGIPDTTQGSSGNHIEALPEYVSKALEEFAIITGELVPVFMIINETREEKVSNAHKTKEAWDEKLWPLGGGAFFAKKDDGFENIVDTIFTSSGKKTRVVTIRKNYLDEYDDWNPLHLHKIFINEHRIKFPIVIRSNLLDDEKLVVERVIIYQLLPGQKDPYNCIFDSRHSGSFIYGFCNEFGREVSQTFTVSGRELPNQFSKATSFLFVSSSGTVILDSTKSYLVEFEILPERNKNVSIVSDVTSIEIGKFPSILEIKAIEESETGFIGNTISVPFTVKYLKKPDKGVDSLLIEAFLLDKPESPVKSLLLERAVNGLEFSVPVYVEGNERKYDQHIQFRARNLDSTFDPTMVVYGAKGKRYENNVITIEMTILSRYKYYVVIACLIIMLLAFVSIGILIRKHWASYKLTDQSLENLDSSGLPETVKGKLEHVKNQKYKNKNEFLKTLKSTIGEVQFPIHQQPILKHTEHGFINLLSFVKEQKIALWTWTLLLILSSLILLWATGYLENLKILFISIAIIFCLMLVTTLIYLTLSENVVSKTQRILLLLLGIIGLIANVLQFIDML